MSEEVIYSWVDLRFFIMGGFAMGGRGRDRCDVAAELEGDIPDITESIFFAIVSSCDTGVATSI